MQASVDRRSFLLAAAASAPVAARTSAGGPRRAPTATPPHAPLFKLSLAQWSFHNDLFGKRMDPLDFAKVANGLGFDAIEYVNQFFKDKVQDRRYLAELKDRARSEGVWSALVMVDREGNLGAPDAAARTQAVEQHTRWLEAAAFLGCHSIRVNAHSEGSPDEQAKLVADGLHRLCEAGDRFGLNVIVENHGGNSSNAGWLTGVMKRVDHPRCGTLPDFGNFKIRDGEEYDRYRGVQELLPFAKAVSAKSMAFDRQGNETTIDYERMMKLVVAAGYHGYVGVEFEAKPDQPPETERDGVLATKRLLEKVRAKLAAG